MLSIELEEYNEKLYSNGSFKVNLSSQLYDSPNISYISISKNEFAEPYHFLCKYCNIIIFIFNSDKN